MTKSNKRQFIGATIGGIIGATGFAWTFRNDGDGTLPMLLSSSLVMGGFPGCLLGALFGMLIGALVDLCLRGRPPQE